MNPLTDSMRIATASECYGRILSSTIPRGANRRQGVVYALVVVGCQAEPTATDARRWFSDRATTIEAVEQRIVAAAKEHPYTGPAVSCEQVIAADPRHGVPATSNADPTDIQMDTRCGNAWSWWHERLTHHRADFDARIAGILDLGGILGVNVVLTRTEPLHAGVGEWDYSDRAACGDVSSGGKALTLPEDGTRVGDHELGWALANLSSHDGAGEDYEDHRYYPTLLVHRTLALPRAQAEYRLQLQATESIPAKYFELEKRRCSTAER